MNKKVIVRSRDKKLREDLNVTMKAIYYQSQYLKLNKTAINQLPFFMDFANEKMDLISGDVDFLIAAHKKELKSTKFMLGFFFCGALVIAALLAVLILK